MSEWTERTRRELADVELLPLEELRALPECGEFDGGIYFLWLGDKLQYVGKSQHIANRLVGHDRKGRFQFDRHTCIALDGGRFVSRDLGAKMQRLERAYIARYEPPFNCLDRNPGT